MNGNPNVDKDRNSAGSGRIWINSLLMGEVGRWLHRNVISAKNGKTGETIVQIAKDSIDSSDEEF